MFDRLVNYVDVPSRALLAAIFILSGIGKLGAFEGTQAYMEAFGLPGFLLLPTIVFEIGAGLGILVGFKTQLFAVLLAGFSLVTAFVFHANFGDQMQQIMFLKNVAMAGGFLILARVGTSGLSADRFLATRNGARA
ncbi:MAG: DoxX family protein [Pirellulales bacterium]